MFPQLTPRSRKHFRVGLIILVMALAGFALLGWQAPMIATSVFGLPVLFASYLREIAGHHDLPFRNLALATVFALGVGVGWALIAGPIVADAYSTALGGEMDGTQILLCGVVIPMSFAVLMVVPAALVRALDRSTRESLDGFTIGAWGATVVNAAATATLLLPQVAMGVTADNHAVDGLFAEAMVEGLAWTLASLATGGIFGIALWFTPAASASRRHRRSVLLTASLVVVLMVVVAMGVVDVAPMPLPVYTGLQLLLAVCAVLALRIVIADALLHEVAEAPADDEQMTCAECDHVVPRMAFCTDCGVAVSAGSASGRTGTYRSVLIPFIAVVGATAAAVVVLAMLIKPAPTTLVCPPDCGKPPFGDPVETNPRYSGDNGAFSVAYPGEGSAYEVTLDPPGIDGVQLKYVGGDTGMVTLFGEPAEGRTPKQIAEQLLNTKYSGATVAYEIPNASVGYQPGYGIVADLYPRTTSSTYTRLRVIIMAAVKHDYALIASATGPYHEFSPSYGTGHPSGANLEVAIDVGKYINSFKWNGDRYGRPS